MAASAWKSPISGDWNTATNWSTGIIPNVSTADVTIDAPDTTGNYLVTIATGASDTINSLSLNTVNNATGANSPTHTGGRLEVDGTLTFGPTSTGAINCPLSSVILMNSGHIVNAGTVDGFFQAGGNSTFTGTNPIYFTGWLQSVGIVSVDTATIGEYNATTKTLFDNIWQANGSGTVLNIGGAASTQPIDVVTLTGPMPTLTPDFWTQLIFTGANSAISEWNGTAYVPIQSTLTTIGESGIVTVDGGSSYTTTNALEVQKDGTFEETSGTLTATGLTIDAGGTLSNGISAAGPNTLAASTDAGTFTVAGNVVNNGMIESFSAGINITGAVSGTGTITYGGASTIDVGSVAVGQTVNMSGSDGLIIDNATGFKGTIAASGAANTIILRNLTATGAALTNGTIQITNGSTVVSSIAETGANNVSLIESGGNAVITLGGAAVTPVVPTPIPTAPTPVVATPAAPPASVPTPVISAALGQPINQSFIQGSMPDISAQTPAVMGNDMSSLFASTPMTVPTIGVSVASMSQWDAIPIPSGISATDQSNLNNVMGASNHNLFNN